MTNQIPEEDRKKIETICENRTYTLRDKPIQRRIEWDLTRHILEQGYTLGLQSAEKRVKEYKRCIENMISGNQALMAVINEMEKGITGQEKEWYDCKMLANDYKKEAQQLLSK